MKALGQATHEAQAHDRLTVGLTERSMMHDRGTPLVVYNSLTRRLEPFTPLRADGSVRMYTCGPTVYAYPHIGNLRAYIFSDTLHRALLWKGYQVRKIVNITDVGHLVADADAGEDKLERAARGSLGSVYELARRYEAAFLDDLNLLRIIPADLYPRATDHIDEMVDFAKVIEGKGFAYRLPEGLYFDTSKSPGYGRLAAMRADEQREGARVEAIAGKRNKNDFAVWRTEKAGEQRLMRWDSPWGWGAPGWHLECSVMGIRLLGRHFDLHTGGVDHRELHHVNEIAQSEAYLDDGVDWVPYWMHNEFLNIKEAKMAKSQGTGLRLTELVEQGHSPAAYRLLMLTAHYRSQTDFSWTALKAASTTFDRLHSRISAGAIGKSPVLTYAEAKAAAASEWARDILHRLDEAISTDLNTARVIATLQEAVQAPGGTPDDQVLVVRAAERILGLGLLEPARRPAVPDELEATVLRLLADRDTARKSRDWATADRIRDDLEQLGVRIKDTPSGTEWEVVGS